MKKSNKKYEITIKILLIVSGIFAVGFFTFAFISAAGIMPPLMGVLSIVCVLLVGVPVIFCFIIGDKYEMDKTNFILIDYAIALDEDIKDRFYNIYQNIQSNARNGKNFYSIYRKPDDIFIIAHMEVDKSFNEEDYLDFIDEIPEVYEQSICHTLIVIFSEKEKAPYLQEIMNCAEYNSLWDTKVYCVYDKEAKRLTVNKTNSGTGNKFYSDVYCELRKIFKIKNKVE